MSFKTFLESSHIYQFFGNCITTVDNDACWDATEMAQYVENSKPLSINNFIELANLDPKLLQIIRKNPSNFEAGLGDDSEIIWLYDIKKDLHYFFRK